MIFGRPGGGKSTFAYKLHQLTGLPIHHLDKHFYEASWVERDYLEFINIQQSIVDSDAWIVDGNATKSFELRYARADLVLYFNFPRWLCYWRTIKRLFCKDTSIDDRADGCRETVRWSLLKYMWSFEDRVKDKVVLLGNKYPQVKFVEVKNDKQLLNLLNMIVNE